MITIQNCFFDGTELAKENPGNFDGLKVHSSGNIFTTGPNGILVLSEDGKLLANIKFKDMLTNCAFDSDESYLYVTGFSFVARISLKVVN
jgi:gluconolactonase